MVFEQPLVNKPDRAGSPQPYFSSYLVDTPFFENSLGILLTDFNKAQVLAKDAVNPKWQKDQKKQAQYRTNGTTKPETQWFCVLKR